MLELCINSSVLNDANNAFCDVWRGIVATGSKAGPVVEVDNFYVTVFAHNAVATIDFHI